MSIHFSDKVRLKLAVKHNIQPHEVEECFCNREKGFLTDTREDHKTNPPTQWFIAETDYGRELKVVFILMDNGEIFIKSAFTPNAIEKDIYDRHATTSG